MKNANIKKEKQKAPIRKVDSLVREEGFDEAEYYKSQKVEIGGSEKDRKKDMPKKMGR